MIDWNSFAYGAVAGWLTACAVVMILLTLKIKDYDNDDD